MCNVCRFSSPVSCQHFQRKTGRCLVGRSQGRESGGLGLFLAPSPSHYVMRGSSVLHFHHLPPNSALPYGLRLGCALGAGGHWESAGSRTCSQSSRAPEHLWQWNLQKTSTASEKSSPVFCVSEKFSCFAGNINHFPMNACTGHKGAIIIVVI